MMREAGYTNLVAIDKQSANLGCWPFEPRRSRR
jgi:hypothetical protein